MAPELLIKEPYDTKADIWSLGVTLFELLTGSRPFKGVSKSDLRFKQSLSKYKVSTSLQLSYECLDFLNCCLQNEPSDRYSADELLKHEFLKDVHQLHRPHKNVATSISLDKFFNSSSKHKHAETITLDSRDIDFYRRTCQAQPKNMSSQNVSGMIGQHVSETDKKPSGNSAYGSDSSKLPSLSDVKVRSTLAKSHQYF